VRLSHHLTRLRRELECALDAAHESANNLQRREWHWLRANLRGVFGAAKRVLRRRRATLTAARDAERKERP
jgi:hypothetical protein